MTFRLPAWGDGQLSMAEVTLAAANARIAHHDKTANLRRFLSTALISADGVIGVCRKVHNQAEAFTSS
jgi:hypothetical protein